MKIFYQLLACGVILSACETMDASAKQPIRANQEAIIQSQRPQLNTVNIIDANLQRTHTYKNGNSVTSGKLAIENAGREILPSGYPEVWVQLRNLTDYPQNILIRTTWYNKSGRPVDGPSAWSRMALSQNAGENYQSSSIRRDAISFMVEIQEVR